MIADLNKIQLGSSFFAKIICREKSIGKLRDGTIYVLTGNKSEWNEAVVKMQESIKTSKIRSLWHLPYNMETLTDFSVLESDAGLLLHLFEDGRLYNLIMPLYTPDRSYKCYLIGELEDVNDMGAAFGFMTVDAQKVCDECSFSAFATSIETAPDKAKDIWMHLIDYNSSNFMPRGGQISFRGKYNTSASEYTFFGKGFEKMINIPKMEYADLIDSLKKLPDTVEALLKNNDECFYDNQIEYVKICQNLSATDKNELILELCKRINDKKILADAIDTVINKGKSSRLKVRVVSKAREKRIDGRRMYGDWCTYLVDENGNKRWLDFEPAAHVIYIMNLINRLKNPDTPSVVKVVNNKQTFIDIYNTIYVYDGDGIEQFNRLAGNVEKKDGTGFERKRLTDCYKIIANCVNIQCSFFNESPSPYITNYDKPLTIDADLIEMSDKFMNQERIKKHFEKR